MNEELIKEEATRVINWIDRELSYQENGIWVRYAFPQEFVNHVFDCVEAAFKAAQPVDVAPPESLRVVKAMEGYDCETAH